MFGRILPLVRGVPSRCVSQARRHAASPLTFIEELADLLAPEQQPLTFALLTTVCTQNTKDAIDRRLDTGAGAAIRNWCKKLHHWRECRDHSRS